MKRIRVFTSNVVVGIALVAAFSTVLALMPFFDRSQERATAQVVGNPNEQRVSAPTEAEIAEMLTTSLAGPAYLVLPPGAFTSDGFAPDGFFIRLLGPGASFFKGQIEENACLVAPVQLPKGVEIKGIEVRLQDSNDGITEFFQLLRTSLTSGIPQVLAEVISPEGTTGGLVGLVDNTVLNAVVDNMYTYQIVTCARPDILVYGVRVGYAYSVSLPLVTR